MCEIRVDRTRFEKVSEFTYLGCVLNESGTDLAECRRMGANGRKVAGTIRSVVNARGLQLQRERMLHETLILNIL